MEMILWNFSQLHHNHRRGLQDPDSDNTGTEDQAADMGYGWVGNSISINIHLQIPYKQSISGKSASGQLPLRE